MSATSPNERVWCFCGAAFPATLEEELDDIRAEERVVLRMLRAFGVEPADARDCGADRSPRRNRCVATPGGSA